MDGTMTKGYAVSGENGYNVAVVGATGAVGREMLRLLEERDFPVATLRAMASSRSAGKELPFRDGSVVVEDLEQAAFEDVDFGLFSAGSSVSLDHAPRAANQGAIVIDNTSAFRMDPEYPLVVPEVNADVLREGGRPTIIANPNCSTIQMVVALQPLEEAAGLERVFVSTYQSASGAGQKGIQELIEGLRAWAEADRSGVDLADTLDFEPGETFAHPLPFEALPHIGSFDESGFTTEELKMVHETRKIMGRPELSVASHCVRVPAIRSHSESLTVDLGRELSVEEVRQLWLEAPGVRLYDEPSEAKYPLARLAEGNDGTWVGRLRQDMDRPSTLHFWVVSDNLRKGAATNSVQIAETLVARDIV